MRLSVNSVTKVPWYLKVLITAVVTDYGSHQTAGHKYSNDHLEFYLNVSHFRFLGNNILSSKYFHINLFINTFGDEKKNTLGNVRGE